jgi:hypothetical protein
MVAQIYWYSMAFVLRMDFSLYNFYARRDTGFQQQNVDAGIFSLFGLLAYRNLSYLFWVICSCASRLHSDDRLCLNQVGGTDNESGAKGKST